MHAVRRAVHDIGPVWDDEVLADPEVQAAIRDNGTVRREYIVTNQDRSALGRIGGAVARVHGVLSQLYNQAPIVQTLSDALSDVWLASAKLSDTQQLRPCAPDVGICTRQLAHSCRGHNTSSRCVMTLTALQSMRR